MAYLDASGITTLTQTYDNRYIKDVNADGIVPVSKGGTGANTAAGALANLGAAAETHTHPEYVNTVTSVNGKTGAVTLEAGDIDFDGASTVEDAIAECVSDSANALGYAKRNSDLYVATCPTAAGTAAKVATVINSQNFTLAQGAMMLVRFTYGNSAATPTLNVNGTGAKTIAYPTSATAFNTGGGTTYNSWGAYEAVLFVYNGTYWVNMGSMRLAYLAYSGLSSKANTASPALTGTPTATTASSGDNSTRIATTAFVQTAVAAAVTGGMAYKGTIGTGGTVTALPTSATQGDVYMVKTAGTWAGKVCEAGDMLICNTTYTTVSDSYWDAVQANLTTLTDSEIVAAVAAA